MARNYYYFVSGLPDLIVDESKNVVAFNAFMEEAMEELDDKDFEVLRALRLPVDNANLISALVSQKKEFDPRGNYSKEEINSALRSPENLDDYMQVFLKSYKEKKQLFGDLTPADQLNWLFYEEMLTHESEYVREWFIFDLNLRNILSAINCRKGLGHIEALGNGRDGALKSTIIGKNEITEAILRSSASDFGLSSALPWIERLLSSSKGELVTFEKEIDQLKWDMAEELVGLSYFGIETIAAFTIRLMIVERWMKLDVKTGRLKLDSLVEKLKNSFTVPAGF
ncbi:DUF2764 family protein [Chitinispirillales bacterium ANBcel5]|uniref:DUF2764 family protein n=1 Tax=Cellulosispirillum alkaliphilum TaxID=3039283 RepID=UPI002A50F334|nr:DUF2764 family protein [Chitinispirillales bacterium ANBcel5]